jgi:hypothetical protein
MNTPGPEKPPRTSGATESRAGDTGATGTSPTRKPSTNKSSQVSAEAREATLQPSISEDAAHMARAAPETVKQTARDATQAAASVAASLSSDVKEAAQTFQEAAKEQASEFASDVGHELKEAAQEQKTRGADALHGFAHAIETAASELEGQSPGVARRIHEAAKSMEGLSTNLRSRSVNELMHAASDLARSQPMVFIAGAVAAGFVLSRFLKSSASDDSVGQGSSRSGGHASPAPGTGSSNPQGTAGQEPIFPTGSVSPSI